ncbi:hypothetical protein SLS53_004361 [Cytospora paraplurivora]|uniref:Arrestin-like N-terminal domain-containing protein n=1 Tax=Cytospora paraplurivora TaxID=2898453 RepID=A0AAN9U8P5_9PEZI
MGGYVEYHLEASLLQQGSHHEKAITATLPIQLRTPSMPYPLVNFDLQQHAWPCAVRAYRLVPGMENVELSLKQKSQQFFHSSKVPKFAFTRREDDETQASPGVYEKATKEKTKSEDAQASAGHPVPGPPSEQLPTYQAVAQQPHTAQPGPLFVPASWGTDEKPVDLGAAVGFRIFPTRAVAFGRSIPGTSDEPMYPDFTTYCIRHSHRLKWKLVIGVAGETVKVEGETPITVIGASQMESL